MKTVEKMIESSQELDLVTLLGGSAMVNVEIRSDFDLITLSNAGITKGSLEALIAHLGMSRKDFTEKILNISVKTLERKKSEDKLDRRISSHIIEIAKVVEHSFEVFENKEKVQQWLNTGNRALNNMKPIDLFYIPTGLAMVDTVLGRIEEGVYS
jgi:putative toxin-antitoxin system antitoxin component (TIGR02293 family)